MHLKMCNTSKEVPSKISPNPPSKHMNLTQIVFKSFFKIPTLMSMNHLFRYKKL